MIDFVRDEGGGGRNWSSSLGKTDFDNAPQSLFETLIDTFKQISEIEPSAEVAEVDIKFPINAENQEMVQHYVSSFMDLTFSIMTQVKGVDSPQHEVTLGGSEDGTGLVVRMTGTDTISEEQFELVQILTDKLKKKYFEESYVKPVKGEGDEVVGYSTTPDPDEDPAHVIDLYAMVMFIQSGGDIKREDIDNKFGLIEYDSMPDPAVLISPHTFEAIRDVELGRGLDSGPPGFSVN